MIKLQLAAPNSVSVWHCLCLI